MNRVKIFDLMSLSLLKQHIENGVVTERKHPTLPLRIYNYSAKAQFDNVWDEVTTLTRGLIVDENAWVIARPFPKFFNINTSYRPETHVDNLPKYKPEVYDKADGSLGIVYAYDGVSGVATRGSFESPQAKWATKHFNELNPWYGEHADPNVTPLCEIIMRANKIVVDYDFEGLVYLALILNKTGEDMCRKYDDLLWVAEQLKGKAVERYEFGLQQALEADGDPMSVTSNREGFVLYYRNDNLRVKVKFEEYKRLHKLLTGISPLTIWEMLRDGKSLDALYDATPIGFQDWVTKWKAQLEDAHYNLKESAEQLYHSCPSGIQMDSKTGMFKDWTSRKVKAEYFLKRGNGIISSICFRMLDGKPYESLIWKAIRPTITPDDVYKKDPD